ncbi:MAG TPA: YggT family protein [Gemmatimonadaceae bacterium]|nr:YggT family protein [Gemmatimonadaceae bacterium]
METAFAAYDAFLAVLRVALFIAAVLLAVVALLDWMVRTRRINAFSPIARFTRSTVDPLLRPIEARVVRAGGMPSAAPWWALVVVIVGGIVLLTLLGFLRGQFVAAVTAPQRGAIGVILLLVRWTFGILKIAIIVRVISSWIRVSPYSKWVHWAYRLTEPILAPLRRVIPTIGMIDLTPLVAYFGLWILEGFIVALLV